MPLSKQDKLALMMTSAKSQRALARQLGVSHQKVGRWLREGESKGVKAIPDSPEVSAAIQKAFEAHRDKSAQIAMEQGTPFNRYRPIYLERKPLRTGQLGDRVFGESTEFIRPYLRQTIMSDQQKTGRYISASVRSIINLELYFKDRAAEELQDRPRKISKKQLAAAMLKSFIKKERDDKNRIVDKVEPLPIYTRYSSISPLRAKDDVRGIEDIENQIRQKHEPATGLKGTVAADQFLFQLTPPGYAPKKSSGKSTANRRQTKGRGNK